MNVNTADVFNSTCPTCLSQGRKFFLIKDQSIELLSRLGIKLRGNDKLCWECKAVLTKLNNFTNKAQMARASLNRLLGSIQSNPPGSLSGLKTSLITTISYKTGHEETPTEQIYIQIGDETQECEVLKHEATSPAPFENNDEIGNIDFVKEEFQYAGPISDTDFENASEMLHDNYNSIDREYDAVNQQSCGKLTKGDSGFLKQFKKHIGPKSIGNNNDIDVQELFNGRDEKKGGTNKIDTGRQILLVTSTNTETLNETFSSKKPFNTTSPVEKVNVCKDGDIYLYNRMDDTKMQQFREIKRHNRKFQKAKYKCIKCIEIFKNESNLNEHNRKHTQNADRGAWLCRVCEQRFSTLHELTTHLQRHYNCYGCRWCTFECDQIDDITRHYEFLHEVNIAECGKCNAEFRTVKDYREHKKKCQSRKPCDVCGRKLTVGNMKRHILTHTGIPQVECDICHKMYRGKSGLRAHMRTHVVVKDESAYCTECDIQFSDLYVYRSHLKNTLKHVAAEDFRYKCPMCDKRFAIPGNMKEHMDARHTDTMNHTCETCNKRYKTKKMLRRHIRVQHEGKPQPRNKVCNICSKTFINKACLEQHMNKHTGARPYACAECGATFGFSGALYMHRKLKHKLQKKNGSEK